jgi:heparosan-N-sulfate-glucuronate 5-epimerase
MRSSRSTPRAGRRRDGVRAGRLTGPVGALAGTADGDDRAYPCAKLHRMRIALIALLLLMGCANPAATHRQLGDYLYFNTEDVFSDPYIRLDPDGVPERYYPGLGWQRNPLTVAQWGLTEFARYVTEDQPGQREAFLTASDWLVSNQRPDGTWTYDFEWFSGIVMLQPGWISGITQGSAISLLARAHQFSGERRYLDAAVLAMQPFTRHVDDGGLLDQHQGLGPTLEEYPSPGASTSVLNGWVFALVGLHELHAVTGNEFAGDLFRRSERALRRMLHLYEVDLDGVHWGVYDLRHLRIGGQPAPASDFYMRVHAYLLEFLYAATGHEPYRELWSSWEASLRSRAVEDLPTDRR